MSTVFHVYYRQLSQKTAMILGELNLYEKVIIVELPADAYSEAAATDGIPRSGI
jgi:hypothetical protein